MNSKSSFYSQRPSAQPEHAIASPSPVYKGEDRRVTARRVQTDRREDVRFELDKEDRRTNQGRRSDDSTPQFW
ncbi:MAG: hypothetical protein NXI15_13630 [Gammaproteobacteria bacterium]|nr:hypothetical protein [Gammaproteobacteria bacterium]